MLQKSIKEGFGLTVTEALWKARPTIGGRAGGIVDQIQDGVTGWLVDSSEEAAQACLEIMDDPDGAARAGRAGKEYVRQAFPDDRGSCATGSRSSTAWRATTRARTALVTAAAASEG